MKSIYNSLKDKFCTFLFQKVSPYYAQKFADEVKKLPHEDKCSSKRGPYQCDCAKRQIRCDLLNLIGDYSGALSSQNFREIEK